MKFLPSPSRRQALAALIASGASLFGGETFAVDAYPSKHIVVVVPFPPGGSIDPIFRPFMEAVARELGQPVILVNRPGAGGITGTGSVAMMNEADGYTIAVMHNSVIRAPLIQKVPWDPLRDLTYLASLFGLATGVTVAADAPWQTMSDLLADAKARPGQLTWGNVGSTSANRIYGERLAKLAGTRFNMVPFKGGAESFQALIGRHLDVVGDPGFGPQVKGGKVRLLATFTANRLSSYPTVPTLKEMGYDLVIESPIGLVAPKQLEPRIAERLNAAFRKAALDTAYLKMLDQFDMQENFMGGDLYTAYAKAQFERERKMLSEIGFKQE